MSVGNAGVWERLSAEPMLIAYKLYPACPTMPLNNV